MSKCNSCEECWINANSDEAYCDKKGERIELSKGQQRPDWCPKMEGADNE